jgi:signal transduction histidine kinase
MGTLIGTEYSPHSHAERLIAAARVILGAFSFLAIWLDPTEPSKYAETAYKLLAGYLLYALLLALVVWGSAAPLRRLGLITHALDLGIFSLFMYLTEGPTSPFFVYFVFSLLCATLRWEWRGTLWTGAAALAMFIGMGVYAAEILHDPQFELNRFIIRSAYLAVVVILLGYLAAYHRRARSAISKLASWSHAIPQDTQALIRTTLEQAAGILGAPRVVMAWEEPEEPWLHLAWWSSREFDWVRESSAEFQPLVAEPLTRASFLCSDLRAPVPSVLYGSPSGFKRWLGVPLSSRLQARLATGALLSVSVRGGSGEGRLFFLDKPAMTSDDLLLGETVASHVALRMDLLSALERLIRAAATEERMRLARDLHDGLLQSLTGMALQLETVRRLLDQEPQAARAAVLQLHDVIAAEQRDVRTLIEYLKPGRPGPPEADSGLATQLDGLAARIERQWGLGVKLKVEGLDAGISKTLAREVYHIVHETLINAARHANASAVSVELAAEDDQVCITAADNGRGFPFRGYYDHAALIEQKLGPATLKERIASLGGFLAIDSSSAGARLEITLPLRQPRG